MSEPDNKPSDIDAQRYRWLRNFAHLSRVNDLLNRTDFNTLDAAVDHLMAIERESEPVSETEKLLPCPFCGADANVDCCESVEMQSAYLADVYCREYQRCTCRIYAYGDSEDEAKRTAIERWNGRENP